MMVTGFIPGRSSTVENTDEDQSFLLVYPFHIQKGLDALAGPNQIVYECVMDVYLLILLAMYSEKFSLVIVASYACTCLP